MNADNWLISPAVELGGTLEFEVLTASAYPDSYAVLLSTTGKEISDFTTTLQAMGTATSGTVSIDLSRYTGQTGYIAIHHVSEDCYYLNIDNFCIRKSEWVTVQNATSPYVISGLESESPYGVQVQAVYAGGTSDYAGISFSTTDENPIPTEVVVDPITAQTATINWYGISDSYDVKYRKISFVDDFENGLDKWTIYTEGGSISGNPGWILYDGMAAAYSWNPNTYQAINADNWLISPAVELDGTLEFDVYTASAYPDSYAVLLSTNGNATTDFTTTLQTMATATSGHVSIDLSAYAGQTGYIAIHHVSNDCYYLDIDNFVIHPASTNDGWNTVNTTDTSVNLTGLVPNASYEFSIIGIKDGVSNAGTPIAAFTTLEATTIELANNADNTELVNSLHGMTYDVKLAGRKFYKDGTWNTLCLPFDVPDVTGTELDGAEIYTLASTNLNGGTLEIAFMEVTKIAAGTPYIVKWPNANEVVTDPVFNGVTFDNTTTNMVVDQNSIVFKGTYGYTEFTEDNKSILFMGSSNTLYYPKAGAKIGAFRAYFELNGITAGEPVTPTEPTRIAMKFGDYNDATGIRMIGNGVDEEIYNIAGQRLNKTQKGINIVNGKKILK
jgi:hypothetical protein